MNKSICKHCGEELKGRVDKVFCNVYCKSAFQYKSNKEKQDSLFVKIDKQLKVNRRILKSFNKAGKTTVRKDVLIEQGFDPTYFTNYWKAENGNVYLFCFEYGYMPKLENSKDKYVLVQWQKYMEKA